MLKIIKRYLHVIAAFASLFSGIFWAASAYAQMEILNLSGANTDGIARQLNILSQHENLWAAGAASVVGIALFFAIFVEIFED